MEDDTDFVPVGNNITHREELPTLMSVSETTEEKKRRILMEDLHFLELGGDFS